MGPIIGIDLGTTFSSVAFLNAYGRAEVIPTLDGRSSVPSVVLFEPGSGTSVVGMSAKERSVEAPDRVVEFVKREMGDPDWVFRVDGKELRPQTISAMILKRLVGMAEGALGSRPEAAVITCPAYFGDLERQATADAGKLAGLNVQAVFNEPTAAALAYGLHHAAKGERVTALVYDLGGGTFDVTVLQMQGRQVQVLATAGEHRLGGKDWDDELLNYVAEEFLVEFGSDPRDDLASMQDLRNRCEAAKIVLSKKSKARVFARAHGQTLKVEISRALFDELTRPLLLQTRTYLDEVLQRAKKRWDDIDVVLPVGGSSHMPQVKKLLGDCMGRAPEAVVDPDLAVVQGATYYAALLRAQEGFEIKCFATSQPRGRVAKQADSDELPALPPAKMEDAPEVLPALPGAVGSAPPADDAAVFAIPMLPGTVGPPRKGAQTRRRPTGPQRPPTRRRPARSGDTIAGSLPGAPAEAVAGSLPPSGRPGRRPPPGKRPPPRRPQEELLAGALPPSGADSMAMGISPIDPTHTAVFDFADVLVLLDEDEPPASNAPVAPPKQQMVLQVNARPLSVLVHQKGQPATSVMIASNTKLPAHKRQRFFTINDGQTGVKLVVLEGDNPDPEQCTRIGECIVSGLPARPKGQPVEVGYSYNEDGRIEVWALDLGTGRQAKSELKREASLTASEWDQAAAIVNGVLGG